jgi:hypothetical protein
VTAGGDKGFDTLAFVAECRHLQVVPHVAQNLGRRGGSAIDGRTTRHPGYGVSQKKRKRIEECFGWLKTIALLRKVRHRGVCKVDWIFTFACASAHAESDRRRSGGVRRRRSVSGSAWSQTMKAYPHQKGARSTSRMTKNRKKAVLPIKFSAAC